MSSRHTVAKHQFCFACDTGGGMFSASVTTSHPVTCYSRICEGGLLSFPGALFAEQISGVTGVTLVQPVPTHAREGYRPQVLARAEQLAHSGSMRWAHSVTLSARSVRWRHVRSFRALSASWNAVQSHSATKASPNVASLQNVTSLICPRRHQSARRRQALQLVQPVTERWSPT
jgi:hypothetical protein